MCSSMPHFFILYIVPLDIICMQRITTVELLTTEKYFGHNGRILCWALDEQDHLTCNPEAPVVHIT